MQKRICKGVIFLFYYYYYYIFFLGGGVQVCLKVHVRRFLCGYDHTPVNPKPQTLNPNPKP